MNKQNIMFGVAGLFLGLIIGFMFANSVNRSTTAPVPVANSAAPTGGGGLPPNHPAIGTDNGQAPGPGGGGGGGPVPEVAKAIDKAKSEPQNYEAQMTAADLYYQIQRFEEAAQFYEA